MLFNTLKAIVEQPGFPYLEAYKQDFYQYDKEYLEMSEADGNRYLWVVTKTGTFIVNLGIHPKMNEWMDAALSQYRDFAIYTSDVNGCVKEIDTVTARDLLTKFDYKVNNAIVSRKGESIASLEINLQSQFSGRPEGYVSIQPIIPVTSFSLRDLVALAQITHSEVTIKSQSLFTATKLISIDGHNIYDLIEQKRASVVKH